MNTFLINTILIIALLATISDVHSASGPPSIYEVEAFGNGATSDEAFKQAVVDAVRQAVGVLVSSENVVNNDRVIKDQILTLSNGFVEKIVSQVKTKLDDGSWQIKLNCLVRTGQIYGRLKELDVPTASFDGVSLFAGAESATKFRKDAGAFLKDAVNKFYADYPSVFKLEFIDKRVMDRTDKYTGLEISFSCAVDRDRYSKILLPPLKNALDNVSLGKKAFRSGYVSLNGGIDNEVLGALRSSILKEHSSIRELEVEDYREATWYAISSEVLHAAAVKRPGSSGIDGPVDINDPKFLSCHPLVEFLDSSDSVVWSHHAANVVHADYFNCNLQINSDSKILEQKRKMFEDIVLKIKSSVTCKIPNYILPRIVKVKIRAEMDSQPWGSFDSYRINESLNKMQGSDQGKAGR